MSHFLISKAIPHAENTHPPGIDERPVQRRAPDVSLIVDRQGMVRFASDKAPGLFGCPIEAILNQPFGIATQPGIIETTIQQPSGAVRHVEMQVVEIDWDDYPAHLIWLFDITEREQARLSLYESEERWQFALEGSGAGVWDLDVLTGKVFRSRQWAHMFGYNPNEISTTNEEWTNRIHPEDKQRVTEEMGWYLRGETDRFVSEYRFRCKDGSYKWVLDQGRTAAWTQDGHPARIVGTATDFSARRQVENELQEYRQRLEEMVLERTSELNQYRRHLEEQVEQRTAELKKVNKQLVFEIDERMQAEEALHRRDIILEAINKATEALLKPFDWHSSSETVLSYMGKATEASRVFLFQNDEKDGKIYWQQPPEWVWVSPGVSKLVFHPRLKLLTVEAAGFGRWEQKLSQNQILFGHVRDLPPLERQFLEEQGVLSVILIPIFVEGKWWGVLGFDFCQQELTWSPGELDALHLAASLLGIAIRRRYSEEEMRRAAEQKTLLMREIHHRVKNNLSIVISLLNMRQRNATPEVKSIIQELELRIRSMALIHEQLYQSVEIDRIPFANYLSNLAITVSSSLGRANIALHTQIAGAAFDIETSLSCGLIANELLTNAYKHAFPENQTGDIYLEFAPADLSSRKETTKYWNLTVSDNGIGVADIKTLEKDPSMGMHIIRLLTKQLKAELTIKKQQGLVFCLTFPERSQ